MRYNHVAALGKRKTVPTSRADALTRLMTALYVLAGVRILGKAHRHNSTFPALDKPVLPLGCLAGVQRLCCSSDFELRVAHRISIGTYDECYLGCRP
jgi:hypothetical protein